MWRCRSLSKLAFRSTSFAANRSLHFRGSGIQRNSATATAALPNQARPVVDQPPVSFTHNEELPIASMDENKVAVGWDPNLKVWSRFHHMWLRDHCRCQHCFHPVTMQRLVNTFEIPPDIKPLHVEAKPDGLEVLWPSSTMPHVSLYPWSWLRRNSYDPQILKKPSSEKILWSSKIQQSPPTVTFEEAMHEDDRGLFKWLSHIDRFGFSFVTGIPHTTEATEKLCERIGFIRETQYGKFWEFTSDLSKGDTAYTTMALSAHTDNTYFTDPCGLQLFHLLSHTDGKGGASLLVDGFYVASILKELHPEVYAVLSKVAVPAHAAGEPGSLYRPHPTTGYPVLGHDPVNGELMQVRWNNDDRSVMNNLQPLEVDEWYNAIRVWNKLLTSPDFSSIYSALTLLTVLDNHRVLHGRSAFDGRRRMCGAYIGVDEYRSKFSVLAEKFASHKEGQAPLTRSVWSPLL
ncbi:mitochondrial protein [Mycena floridula]|nr:mitochondrial protein [Mycena floridula]